MRHPHSIRILGALAATLAVAAPLSAQVRFAPTVGVYMPTGNLADVVIGSDSLAELKQDVGLALGANLGVGLGQRVVFQLAGSYVPSQLSGTVSGVGTWTQSDANLFFGNANLTFYVVKPTSPVWFSLSGGGSVVDRSGAAYDGVEGTTDYGGLVGATIGFRLGGLLSFNVSATDYIYGAQFEKDGYTTSETPQNDILIGLGLGIPLGGQKSPTPTQTSSR